MKLLVPACLSLASVGILTLGIGSAQGQTDEPSSLPSGRLLFTRYTGAGLSVHGEIYVVRTDGTRLRQLTDGRGSWAPDWHPNRKQFVYVNRAKRFTNTELVLKRLDGTHRERLTRTFLDTERDPVFSPDGTLIAYEDAGPWDGSDLHVIDPVTKEYRVLVQADVASSSEEPTWSPDGREIAFYDYFEYQHLVIAQADTQQSRYLATGFDVMDELDWSPDGDWLVAGAWRDSRNDYDLYLVPVEGGDPVPLVTGPGDQLAGSFSPDGRFVAYTDDSTGNGDVYIVEISSKRKWQVTRGPRPDYTPMWEPAEQRGFCGWGWGYGIHTCP